MVQNRNKLIDLFIGNTSNAVVHKILEEAIDDEVIRKYYDKEFLNSIEIAKTYREKINPVNGPLPEKGIDNIKNKIISNVTNDLNIRVSKSYENIKFDLIESTVNKMLIEMKVINN
ncbi:MAG: hypothetical protein IH934_03780 [Nanoarchaeota archaeon]|nr:hypothetical protein [Nanoarchaeota archaeon]